MPRKYYELALEVVRGFNDPELLKQWEELKDDPDIERAGRMLWLVTALPEERYEDFCEKSEPELVKALTALAVPRRFDRELAESILTEHLRFTKDQIRPVLGQVEWLHIPFCHGSKIRGWKFDEEARAFFIQKAKDKDAEGLLDLYKLLATYYAEKLEAKGGPMDYGAPTLALYLAECELHFDHKMALDRLAVLAGRAIVAQEVGVPNGVAWILRENEELLASKVGTKRARWIIAHYETLYRWARERVISC